MQPDNIWPWLAIIAGAVIVVIVVTWLLVSWSSRTLGRRVTETHAAVIEALGQALEKLTGETGARSAEVRADYALRAAALEELLGRIVDQTRPAPTALPTPDEVALDADTVIPVTTATRAGKTTARKATTPRKATPKVTAAPEPPAAPVDEVTTRRATGGRRRASTARG